MENEKREYQYKSARLYFVTLKPDNVESFFATKYNKWLYYTSSKVTIDGNNIDAGLERFVNTLPESKKGNTLKKTAEISCTTKNGFDLTVGTFVDEELKKYNELYIESEGNSKYRELRLKIKEYTDHLKKIKGKGYDINIPCINSNLVPERLKLLFDNLIDREFIDIKTDKDYFNYALNGTPLPIGKVFKPIIWLKNKQLLRELLFGCKEQNTKGIVDDKASHVEIERIISLLFCDSKNKPFKLAKNKYVESIDSDKIKGILAIS